ncbi:MAG: aminotransferase class V-fold PLP-dependent enzyme [Bacteroidota bacterium]
MMDLQEQMFEELKEKKIFDQARSYAFSYADGIEEMQVYPSRENLERLAIFDEAFPDGQTSAENIIHRLHEYGSPATIAQTGGRYYGFVDGGAVPVSIATKWLSDFWDQCGGLYLTSPINAKLEAICENWLKEIFNLPDETVAGFVSGTSMANLSGLAAARFRLLHNQGWDVNARGLNGAPKIRVIAHAQVHASIKKTLAILGLGIETVEWLPSDDQGRLIVDKLPKLDNRCLLLLQAGNANTGAFDSFAEVCEKSRKAGAWVHIDGAFGLWAAASKTLAYLTQGMEHASSWSVDGHKTLNTPYDSGIVLCRDSEALVGALQTTGEYIIYSDQKDPILYGPEMSKRSRAIELWATMKYLGKSGIDKMVTGFHTRAKQLEEGLRNNGYTILNDVVFNQVLVACDTEELTKLTLQNIQNSGSVWCGGSTWLEKSVIRISVCSWATTKKDITTTIEVFKKAKHEATHMLSIN